MARIRVEDHRVVLAPGQAPQIELIVGRVVAGRCRFMADARGERATMDVQTGYVELTYDLGDYDRVLGLLQSRRPVWVGEELRLEG